MKQLLAVLALCVLSACPVTPVDPYPIGGGLKISGQIENWPSGTVAGILSNHFIWTQSPFGPNIGKVNADGSFTLGLPSDAQLEPLKAQATFIGCNDPKPVITPNTVKIYPIVFSLSINGQGSGPLLNTDKLPAFGREAPDSLGVHLVYSDGNATISGQCVNYNDALNLTLVPGWNTVVVSTNPSGAHSYQVGAAPPNLKWFKAN